MSAQACNVGGFRIQSLWNVHVDSDVHCSTLLKLFYSMDNREFFRLYGDVPYAKSKDVPQLSEYSNDIERHMAVRSGILNDFDCRVSGILNDCDCRVSGILNNFDCRVSSVLNAIDRLHLTVFN